MDTQIEGSAHELQDEEAWYTGWHNGNPSAHHLQVRIFYEDLLPPRHMPELTSLLHTPASRSFT